MERADFKVALFLLLTTTPIEIQSDQVCPLGLTQLGNFCYQTIEGTSFPFDCPLRSTYRYGDGLDFLCLLDFNKHSWINIKRNQIHGYFEYPELHAQYGYLFVQSHDVPSRNDEDCMLRQGNQPLETIDCSSETEGLCVYHREDRQFCQTYNKICNVSSDCHCHSSRIAFLCQTECDGDQGPELPPELETTPDELEEEPEPELQPDVEDAQENPDLEEEFEEEPELDVEHEDEEDQENPDLEEEFEEGPEPDVEHEEEEGQENPDLEEELEGEPMPEEEPEPELQPDVEDAQENPDVEEEFEEGPEPGVEHEDEDAQENPDVEEEFEEGPEPGVEHEDEEGQENPDLEEELEEEPMPEEPELELQPDVEDAQENPDVEEEFEEGPEPGVEHEDEEGQENPDLEEEFEEGPEPDFEHEVEEFRLQLDDNREPEHEVPLRSNGGRQEGNIPIQSAHVCSKCDERFDRYPQPEITLKFDRSVTIKITVRNALKLITLPDTLPIYCFSDVYVPDEFQIRHRFFGYELMKLEEESDGQLMMTYIIELHDPLAVGFYWCEGFSLPKLEKVASNKVLAGVSSSYGLNLVLNFTSEEFSLHPYDVHTSSISRLQNIIGAGRYQLIRPPEPPTLTENRSKAHLTLHLTTHFQLTDAEDEFENLSNELAQCEAAGLRNCSLAFSNLCLPVETTIDSFGASWPKVFLGQPTPPNEILLQANGSPIRRRCTGSFMKGAFWSDVIGRVYTSTGSAITKPLHDLLNSNKTAEELNQDLHDTIDDVVDVIPYDVYLIARIFERIAQSQEYFDLELFIRSVDAVAELDLGVLQLAQNDLNATDIILYNVDLALGTIAWKPTTKTIKAKNLMALVMGLNVSGENPRGFAVYQFGKELKFSTLPGVYSIEQIDLQNLRLATFIPFPLMTQILEQNLKPNLVAVVYLSDALFRGDQSKLGVASFALSIYVTGFVGTFLRVPLSVIFDANFEAEGYSYCAFWEFGNDEMLVAMHGDWRKTGTSGFHHSFKLCGFSHMTHFALLANAPRNHILDLISLIGCVLSMLGVVGIFVTAMAFKTWRDSATTKILLNLSATIFIQMLLLFLWHVNGSKLLCKIISMGLHYIILSQFCWMLVIGYLQYRKLVRVLVGKSPKFLLCSYVICWLLPVLPVVIIYVLHPESYAVQNYCHVSGLGLYFGLLAPIGFAVVTNAVIFVLIFVSLACNKTTAFGHKDSRLRDKVKLCLLLFFLLGFSWIFGLLAHLLRAMVLSYLFCVTAALQGFVLYVYFVLCEKSTRAFWGKRFRCCGRIKGGSRKGSSAKCNDESSCSSEDKATT